MFEEVGPSFLATNPHSPSRPSDHPAQHEARDWGYGLTSTIKPIPQEHSDIRLGAGVFQPFARLSLLLVQAVMNLVPIFGPIFFWCFALILKTTRLTNAHLVMEGLVKGESGLTSMQMLSPSGRWLKIYAPCRCPDGCQPASVSGRKLLPALQKNSFQNKLNTEACLLDKHTKQRFDLICFQQRILTSYHIPRMGRLDPFSMKSGVLPNSTVEVFNRRAIYPAQFITVLIWGISNRRGRQ